VLDRAYALLSIKSVDVEQRIIEGIATTPSPDRGGDEMIPSGAQFTLPIPFLWKHTEEVGEVFAADVRVDGIHVKAKFSQLAADAPEQLKTRVETAWHSVSAKPPLVRGLSIGWKGVEGERTKRGTMRWHKWIWGELSAVTVPMNVDATILAVKQAASGPNLPGVSGQPLPRRPMKTTTAGEHIQNLENKRAALAARMTELMETAATEGTTLEAEAATEHDGLADQVKSIDADLQRWRDHEKMNIAAAAPVPQTPGVVKGYTQVSVKPNVPLGMAFVRKAIAELVCHGNKHEAAIYAERWNDSTPEVALALKAAIAPGTTTDATWASPLVNQTMVSDFIELLRPATILGKVPGLRNVPFNCKVPMQTAGGTYGWVGEAKPKPLTKLAFSSDTLGITKVAGIIVLTEELVRLSNPSAEALVRADMVAGIAQFLDSQFIDPAVAAVAGVNPASITNGAPTAAATTNPVADIMGLINHFATNNIAVDGVTFIMSPANALSLSFRSNLDGSPEFPGVGLNGGNYRGLTFITSNVAGANVVALQPALILYADDGGVTIDASREASLQMDSAPMSPADATTVYVSLFQTNSVALRAERFINWKRVNANAVKYLTATAWPAPTGVVGERTDGANGKAKH